MQVYNFFVCGPKFTIFFSPNVEGVVVDQVFSDFRYVDLFRRYSRTRELGGSPAKEIKDKKKHQQ